MAHPKLSLQHSTASYNLETRVAPAYGFGVNEVQAWFQNLGAGVQHVCPSRLLTVIGTHVIKFRDQTQHTHALINSYIYPPIGLLVFWSANICLILVPGFAFSNHKVIAQMKIGTQTNINCSNDGMFFIFNFSNAAIPFPKSVTVPIF